LEFLKKIVKTFKITPLWYFEIECLSSVLVTQHHGEIYQKLHALLD